jgi:hypothetical protein
MSSFDPEDYGLQPVQETVPRNWRRQMEAEKKAAEDENAQLKARLAAIERNQAFADAGIPNDGLAKYFRDGYKGDLTPEAIRAEFGTSGSQAAQTQASLQGHAQAQAMAAGASAAPAGSVAAEFAALRASARAKRNGASFNADKAKLGELLAREGVEPNPTNWQLPRQLVQ